MENILIAGGSGYVGRALTKKLQDKGYTVSWLTRKIDPQINITQYLWNWEQNSIDLVAIEKAELIINLAGANVNGRRWTKEWKKEIYDSRICATKFLFEIISKYPNKIKTYISASATGFYGRTTSEKIYTETDSSANDFLAKTCYDWEQLSNKFTVLGIRTLTVRTGIVLSRDSKAFKKMALPIRLGLGAAIGNGNQFFPWIHLDDLCRIYLKLISDNNLHGTFNAVAPQYLTNQELMKAIAQRYNKSIWLPNIPSLIVKLIFGEIADSILNGSRISSEKIINCNFKFKYLNINACINS